MVEVVEAALFGKQDLFFLELTSDHNVLVKQLNEMVLLFFFINHVKSFLFLNSQQFLDLFLFPSMVKLLIPGLVVKVYFRQVVVLESQLGLSWGSLFREGHVEVSVGEVVAQ